MRFKVAHLKVKDKTSLGQGLKEKENINP